MHAYSKAVPTGANKSPVMSHYATCAQLTTSVHTAEQWLRRVDGQVRTVGTGKVGARNNINVLLKFPVLTHQV